ncbi:MAG: M20/M25/M40 family metallo-hydrolase [Candidatus Cloacimonetes bacterium]|nr:M20/M25/M40 family metallo-hydrolase [Candidatus Cloacimonadota bacterium]
MFKFAITLMLGTVVLTEARTPSRIPGLLDKALEQRIIMSIPEFQGEWSYVTMDSDAVKPSSARFRSHYEVVGESGGIALVRVPKGSEDALSAMMHKDFRRCAGFVSHESEEDAFSSMEAMHRYTRQSRQLIPPFEIDNSEQTADLISKVNETRVRETILSLSTMKNRYYRSTEGVLAAQWIHDHWKNLIKDLPGASVRYFEHKGWPQKSVIVRIEGTKSPDEVVILGGHLDSTSGMGGNHITAPGADDNASGIACLTEVIRVASETGFRPARTVEFMAYAAEEVGLKGSGEIAQTYKRDGVKVVGVMQLDMTNFNSSKKDIYIFEDYTNPAQNQFLKDLVDTYLTDLTWGVTKCGYACSDHASWTRQGFAASYPAESSMDDDNPYIHSIRDTIAQSGGHAQHAAKFARLGLAYMAEASQ